MVWRGQTRQSSIDGRPLCLVEVLVCYFLLWSCGNRQRFWQAVWPVVSVRGPVYGRIHFPIVGETGMLLRFLALAILHVIDKSSRANSGAGPRLGGGWTLGVHCSVNRYWGSEMIDQFDAPPSILVAEYAPGRPAEGRCERYPNVPCWSTPDLMDSEVIRSVFAAPFGHQPFPFILQADWQGTRGDSACRCSSCVGIGRTSSGVAAVWLGFASHCYPRV